MIHLDHNHAASLPAHASSPSLILANSPHADQAAASPWSSPSRDPRPFYPDSQDHAPPEPSEQPQPAQDEPQDEPSLPHSAGPGAPTDSQNPLSLSEPSPRSTADARSPPPDSNSSLTPPPDAATPNPATEAPSQPPEDTTDTAGMAEQSGAQGSEEVDKASRQSTPLSELSSAPETAPDDENTGGDSKESGGADTNADGPSTSSQQSSSTNHNQQNISARSAGSGGDQSASTGGQAPKQGSDGSLSRQHSQASSLSPTHSKAPSLDPKVVSILELNSLLLRVSMDFQARGVPMTDQIFHQYSLRLQSNLTWIAAAADENHKVSQSLMALPIMTPPPVVEFAEMDRIMHVYRELPNIFSKELARRQQAAGPGAMNGNAKRERTEEPFDNAHKRRDTGETKAQTPSGFSTPGAGPSTPLPPPQLMSQNSSHSNLNMSGGPVQRMSSPSMPPPPVPPGAMGPNDAQVAAMRARQLQMRQAQQQQAQQQQQQQQQQLQQQHSESSRQMSPPAGMGPQHGGAGPSPIPTLSQLTPAQLANLQSMGPMAVQHFQVLQNPSHPFMQYLVSQVPGFMSLPTMDKLQKMQVAQTMLQARRQAQAQGGNGGFPQGPIAPQHSGEGSPSRMSPVQQQQSPMQQSFPYGSGGGGAPNESRMMFTPQQQAALAQMNPQQRQLLLMQQQMLRGGGGGGGGGGNGMNPQAMGQQQMMQERMRLEQQRMQAAAASQGGSQNMGGMDGSQFPALRSNPGMPGIARSARTPSESGPSPVSQHRMGGGQSPEEQHQRAMMMQQAQAQRAMAMSGGGGGGFPGGQQGGAQGWSQNGMGQMQQQQQMGMGGQSQYGMVSPPGSAGGSGGGGGGFPGMGGAPSPAASGNGGQMWSQGGGQFGGGPFMAPSPSASQHEGMTPGRGASGTPGPHQQMQGSPTADQAGLNDLDFFNWGQ